MGAADRRTRSPCIDDATFERLFSGAALGEEEVLAIDAHAAECEECAARLADFGLHGDGSPSLRRIPVDVGDVIDDKYEVESLLGTGGAGAVVRARRLVGGERVALKLLRPGGIGDGIAVMRLLREARAASALESPHAVRILDVGRTKSAAPYLVMECLNGRDLARAIAAEGPLDPPRAVDYVLQALDALVEAHARGIIHRDLKPQNLFLTDDGKIKVLDFGLAKLVESSGLGAMPLGGIGESQAMRESHATRTNVMLGSPRYMSPEQLASPREIDRRADVWSLGATLFHLLTGVPPFRDTNLLVLATRIFGESAPRVRSLRASVPALLDEIVATCLCRERDERYADAAELKAALDGAKASPELLGWSAPVAGRAAARPIASSSGFAQKAVSAPSSARAPVSSAVPKAASRRSPPSAERAVPKLYADEDEATGVSVNGARALEAKSEPSASLARSGGRPAPRVDEEISARGVRRTPAARARALWTAIAIVAALLVVALAWARLAP